MDSTIHLLSMMLIWIMLMPLNHFTVKKFWRDRYREIYPIISIILFMILLGLHVHEHAEPIERGTEITTITDRGPSDMWE